jgi:hypothetical protein
VEWEKDFALNAEASFETKSAVEVLFKYLHRGAPIQTFWYLTMTRTQGQGQRPWWKIHLRLDSSIPTVSLVLFTGAGVRFRVVVRTKESRSQGGGAWWTVQALTPF